MGEEAQRDLLPYLIEGRHAFRQRSRLSELFRQDRLMTSRQLAPASAVSGSTSVSGNVSGSGGSIDAGRKQPAVQGVIVRVKTCQGGGFEDLNSRYHP